MQPDTDLSDELPKPAGVTNLRAAFERLAMNPPSPLAPNTNSEPDLLSPNYLTSRQRAYSGLPDKPSPPPVPSRSLRPSSSSNDLKAKPKRLPPPPPPPRGSSPSPVHAFNNDMPSTGLGPAQALQDMKLYPPGGPSKFTTRNESPFDDPVIEIRQSSKIPCRANDPEQPLLQAGHPLSPQPPPLPNRRANSLAPSLMDLSLNPGDSSDGPYPDDFARSPAPVLPPRRMASHHEGAGSAPLLAPLVHKIRDDPPVYPASGRTSVEPHSRGLHNPPVLPPRKTTKLPSQSSPTVAQASQECTIPSKTLSPEVPPVRHGHRLPPPKRNILLGEKLPPARRPPSETSSESEDDDSKSKHDPVVTSNRASRRPPLVQSFNFAEFKIHVPSHDGIAAVSGQIVAVASPTSMKVYDVSESDTPIHVMENKRLCAGQKISDFRISSIEFPSPLYRPLGCFLWIGTKEGHLIEIDVLRYEVSGFKYAAHTGAITHIFRHQSSMITIDIHGKILVFSLEFQHGRCVEFGTLQPRVVRIAERPVFVKLLGRQLLAVCQPTMDHRVSPVAIKTYDITLPNASIGCSVVVPDTLTQVLSATVLPCHPDRIYLGHVGGYISMFQSPEDGNITFGNVTKVSASDILSLEGVNDRLWVGSRNGSIMVLDINSKPWNVTNCWLAHPQQPVSKLAVDAKGIANLKQLPVYSIGRDELRFWDGLLGSDWIEQRMIQQEAHFCVYRTIKALIISWNVDAMKPDTLVGKEENYSFLSKALKSVTSPDIIVFGFQELIDLESRKMAAKTVLLGSKHKTLDGSISQKVTTSYRRWYDHLVLAVQLAMPANTPYTVVHTDSLVGLFSCVFVKNSECPNLRHVAISSVKCGMGGRYGNKGGIVGRFIIDDSSICFVNCHLAAGQKHTQQRNKDINGMLNSSSAFSSVDVYQEASVFVNGGDGSMILDHEVVFINGDLNYRIDMSYDQVISAIQGHHISTLLQHDQLYREQQFNIKLCLYYFKEAPITFLPTYKYDPGSNSYDTSEKQRVPAWCDRILWKSFVPHHVKNICYQRHEVDISDHRPVSGGFDIVIKNIDREVQAKMRSNIYREWIQEKSHLLESAEKFYMLYY